MRHIFIGLIIEAALIIVCCLFSTFWTMLILSIVGAIFLLLFFEDMVWIIINWLRNIFRDNTYKCILIGLLFTSSLTSNAQLYLGMTKDEIVAQEEVIRYSWNDDVMVIYWHNIMMTAAFNDYGFCYIITIPANNTERAKEIMKTNGVYINYSCYKHYNGIAYYISYLPYNNEYYLHYTLTPLK